jgi:hypothetical protein
MSKRASVVNLAEARAQTGTPLYGAYLVVRDEAVSPGEQIVPARARRPA